MKNLIRLKQKVKESLGLNVVHYKLHNNYTWNGIWVAEISPQFLYNLKEEIIDIIDKNINEESEGELEYLKKIKQNIIEIISSLNDVNPENLNSQCFYRSSSWEAENLEPSINDATDFTLQDLFGVSEEEIIVDTIKDFVDFGNNIVVDSEDVQKHLKKEGYTESEVKGIFAKGHLLNLLELHKYVLEELSEYIDSYFETLEEIRTSTVDKFNTSSPNPLQFNLTKKEFGLLFHTLHQIGVVSGDFKNPGNAENLLKKNLNSGNYLYYKNGGYKPVINIEKEFGNYHRKNDNYKPITDTELNFLENSIQLLQERLRNLKEQKLNR